MVITLLQHITYVDCCCWMFDTITMWIAKKNLGRTVTTSLNG